VSRAGKVLVTGARGFIGKNLVVALRRADVKVTEVDVESSPGEIDAGVSDAQVVFHLAGVNRPKDETEFKAGNVGSLEAILAAAERSASKPLVVLSSSTQAAMDNPYGKSKLAAEKTLESYAGRTGASVVIYRFPGVFGKWCRPAYNSVVATFCDSIAHDRPIEISDPSREIELVYVDDVVAQLLTHLAPATSGVTRGEVRPVFRITLGELAQRIQALRAMRESVAVPDLSDAFTRRLLATYTSYLPASELAYSLAKRSDQRGTLAELAKEGHFGQIFVSRTHPGMTRGNHYHDTKVEKFCVLDGDAVIRFRSVLGDTLTEHRISGKDFKVVDIPPGMTHSIENVGTTEMIVLFWASEMFDPDCPDTYFEEVLRG
jgi:UDP-2-acetamido-2,6-beta-L-arabino-hexul-4-ose reductase